MTRHAPAFIEQALTKVYARGDRSITAIADDLHINHHTLRYWMKNKTKSGRADGALTIKEKRPQDWTAAEQLEALQTTHGLSGEPLQAWCRAHGIFAHHLADWEASFCAEGKGAAAGMRELRALKEEIATLKREAVRKDKALAEAAALLILQKKFRALWEGEDK